ncbi:MAG TPA: PAS domain S-box protein, partial [Longimicrobium sp.]|nr:PAS domain S-box protein [Longimicrobium sp.]
SIHGLVRTRAQRALEAGERRFRAAMEYAPIGMAIVGLDGRWLEANRALCRLTGYTEDELRAIDFQRITHPDDLYADLSQVERLLAGEAEWYEMEKRYIRRDGTVVWILLTASLVRDGESRALYFVAQIQDITERLGAQAQLAAYARELERSNRELADFAYVASHDLQEPLRKIQAFGDLLAERSGPALDATGRDSLERMQGAARRMSDLVRALLDYSRVGTRPAPFTPVDLAQAARDAESDLAVRLHSTGGRVEIGALPEVEADGMMMRQLLLNLVGNAVKFHRPDVPPVVRVEGRILGADEAPPGDGVEGWAEVVVRDNGIGFEPRFAERIFAPFQRLHGRGEFDGTGMGLAICRRIAERHGGTLEARGEPGAGSTFILRLPVRRQGPEET